MRAEFPIFPLIFMLTVIIALATTFISVFSISTDIGSPHAGVRSAIVIELFNKHDQANRFVETATLLATRDRIAEHYRNQRYPCPTQGRFIVYSSSCEADVEDVETIVSGIVSVVERTVNAQIATHPDAWIPPVTIEKWAIDGRLVFDASTREEAVFVLNSHDWTFAVRDTFSMIDSPVHTGIVAARADVHELIDPFIKEREEFDSAFVDLLIEEAHERGTTYCPNDLFAPIVAVEYLEDLIEACPLSEEPCTCGSIRLPPDDRYTITLEDRSVRLTNVYDFVIDVSKELVGMQVQLDRSREQEYLLVMEGNKVSLVDPDEVDPAITRCMVSAPKINMFTAFDPSFPLDINYDRDGSNVRSSSIFDHQRDPPSLYDQVQVVDRVAIYNYGEQYRTYPPETQEGIDALRLQLSGRTVPKHVEGLNIILTTHEEGSSILVRTSEGLHGVIGLFDTILGHEELYPAREARLEVIWDELGAAGEDQRVRGICMNRIHDHSILSEPIRVVHDSDSRLSYADSFFEPVTDNGRFMIVSIPSQTVDECGRERTLESVKSEVHERVFRAAARAAVLASYSVPGELLCLDDPMRHVTHHPFFGYNAHKVYPYVIVPQPPSDFIWPLADIGAVTQCWGPPTKPWAFDRHGNELIAPYSFHRGLDLQPSGGRLHWGTVFEHFPNGKVVAIADGKVVYAAICGLSVFAEHYPMQLAPFFIADSGDEGIAAALAEIDGKSLAEEYCGTSLGGGFGEHIVIEHDEYYAIYAHLAPGSVLKHFAERDNRFRDGLDALAIEAILYRDDPVKVSQGDVLGLVGNTGTSTGAHLHFEIYRKDDGRITGSTKRPIAPQGGYAPSASSFVQFNPFCVLPQEVEALDGSTYDISDVMPGGASFEVSLPETSTVEHDVPPPADASSGFDRPRTLSEQCFANYAMAYYGVNTEFSISNYGVCP